MSEAELLQIGGVVLIALTISGLVFALAYPYFSGDKQGERRLQQATSARGRAAGMLRAQQDNSAQRRKQVTDTLKDLEERQQAREKVTLRLRLERAGLDVTPKNFWIASMICGVLSGALFFMSFPSMSPIALVAVVFAGTFGLPRWILAQLIKRRQAKFLSEFANSIDVIVRGVKSGLPLNECLSIIARESPEPLASEFKEVVEQQRVGVPLGEALLRMTVRMPLAETRFFAIVIGIQQQAGGNLSEALGNLSGVLRDRKTLQMKVKALSSEAKASAGVLASLPFVVMILVYLSTPSYVSMLWTTKSGQFLMGFAGFWMFCGVTVMRKMINFKY